MWLNGWILSTDILLTCYCIIFQHYVIPKCGRMVGFSAGGENMHGVKPITKGKRCAVALWFTHDLKYKELSFEHAETLLSGAH